MKKKKKSENKQNWNDWSLFIWKRPLKVLKSQSVIPVKSLILVWYFSLKILMISYVNSRCTYLPYSYGNNYRRCPCVTRVTQPWNVFVNNFQVLRLFIEATKHLCDWKCITIPCDADTFWWMNAIQDLKFEKFFKCF